MWKSKIIALSNYNNQYVNAHHMWKSQSSNICHILHQDIASFCMSKYNFVTVSGQITALELMPIEVTHTTLPDSGSHEHEHVDHTFESISSQPLLTLPTMPLGISKWSHDKTKEVKPLKARIKEQTEEQRAVLTIFRGKNPSMYSKRDPAGWPLLPSPPFQFAPGSKSFPPWRPDFE